MSKTELEEQGYIFIAKSIDDYNANLFLNNGKYTWFEYMAYLEDGQRLWIVDTLDNIEIGVKNTLYLQKLRDEKLKQLGI